jgi:hypothetical protein
MLRLLLFTGCLSGCLATDLEIGKDMGTIDTGPTPDTSSDTGTIITPTDADGDGFTPEDGDCDDTNADISPDATEICDSLDNNCNGLVDDDDPDLDLSTATDWYADSDQDGFGDETQAGLSCNPPLGTVLRAGDCDDGDAEINPDAAELCDLVDHDCDGDATNGFDDSDRSGTVDCREVAVVLSWAFQDNDRDGTCDNQNYVDREFAEINAILNDMELEAVAILEDENDGIDFSQIEPYALTIYHNGGWSDSVRTNTIEALVDLHEAGQALLLVGDDVGNQINKTYESTGDGRLQKMAAIASCSSNNDGGNNVKAADAAHPFVDGTYGLTGGFSYVADLDQLTLAETDGLSVAMYSDSNNNPVSWSIEKENRGRVGVIQPSLYNSHDCPISDEDGLLQIATLFQNAMDWLMNE